MSDIRNYFKRVPTINKKVIYKYLGTKIFISCFSELENKLMKMKMLLYQNLNQNHQIKNQLKKLLHQQKLIFRQLHRKK